MTERFTLFSMDCIKGESMVEPESLGDAPILNLLPTRPPPNFRPLIWKLDDPLVWIFSNVMNTLLLPWETKVFVWWWRRTDWARRKRGVRAKGTKYGRISSDCAIFCHCWLSDTAIASYLQISLLCWIVLYGFFFSLFISFIYLFYFLLYFRKKEENESLFISRA